MRLITRFNRFGMLVCALLIAMVGTVAAIAQDDATEINPDETIQAELTEEAPRNLYSFTTDEDTQAIITLTSNDFDAYLLLLDEDGDVVAEDDDSAGRLNSQIEYVIEEAGTYTIVATSLREYSSEGRLFAIGDYEITLEIAQVADSVAEATEAPEDSVDTTLDPLPSDSNLIYGDSVEGTLTSSNVSEEYTFEAEAGDLITITLTSEDFDTYLFLYDAEGFQVARDDDSAGSLDSRIGPLSIPDDGTYTIEATSFAVATSDTEFATGDYRLSLVEAEVNTIVYNEPVTGTIDDLVPTESYTLDASEGDAIIVTLDTNNFSIYMEVTGPDGLFRQTFGGTGVLGPFFVTEDTTYNITMNTYNSFDPGDYTLLAQTIAPSDIEIGEEITVEFEDDGVQFFTFEGQIGDSINIIVDSEQTIDTQLTVTGPDNFEVAFDDDGGAGLDPEITNLILFEEGTYAVLLRPFILGDTGEVTLLIERNSQPDIGDDTQTLRISDKQIAASVSFEGEAGEIVQLSARVLSATGRPYITITQDGEILAENSIGTVERLILEFTIPQDGPVTVSLEDLDLGSSVIEFSLERMTAD